MTWNYRLIHHDNLPDEWIGLHEVYYENDEVSMWTEEAIRFIVNVEEGSHGMIASLEMALQDAKKYPVLSLKQLLAEVVRRKQEKIAAGSPDFPDD